MSFTPLEQEDEVGDDEIVQITFLIPTDPIKKNIDMKERKIRPRILTSLSAQEVFFTYFKISLIAGFVLAGVLGTWFAETITRPVVQLRDLADRVSKGDLNDVEVDIKRNDEIGQLAAAFRRMVASLRFTRRRAGTAAGTVEPEQAAS